MKKNKRLILHIGTIKTGTSSIQDSLGKARDVLLEHNIYYPSIQPYNHIFTFPPIFMKNPEVIDWFRRQLRPFEDKNIKIQGYREAWLKEFVACASHHDFIISAEHLSAALFSQEAVERLKEFIEPYFELVSIIVYIRHYDTWIASEIQQKTKNGRSPAENILEIARHLQNCPPAMSYQQSLQKWINVFGREAIVVRPFDPQSFYKHSLLADFFRACKLPADDISITEIRSNESIGRHGVAFLQKYNQTYPIFINNSINLERGLAREGIPVHLYENVADEKFKLDLVYSTEQAQKLNQEIDYVNQFFADGYQFQHVSAGDGETQTPKADNIPIEFFVELVNNYNKQIESQRTRIEKQQEQNESLRKQNESIKTQNESIRVQNESIKTQNEFIRKQNAYFQKVLDVLKISHFLRAIKKMPRLKKLLQKITSWQKV